MSIAFYNGEFLPIDQQVVGIEDRGHQFGDGIYEVIRAYGGRPFLMREHLVRLENSARVIRIDLPYTIEQFEDLIRQGLERAGLQNSDAEIYMQISRGTASRLHTFPKDTRPNVAMTFKPARALPADLWEKGVAITLLVDERWANVYIKSLNLLPNVIAKQAATEAGYYEAVFFKDGYITDGSSTNVFAIKDGVLYTPPATKRILHGITRAAVLDIAKSLEIPTAEEEITPDFLANADEVFITSTSIEVLGVHHIEDKQIGDGTPGPITRRLHAAYRDMCKK
jgi:D-alanine transaminase